jgi:uncharacterized protein (PEP-CTERM system associated)
MALGDMAVPGLDDRPIEVNSRSSRLLMCGPGWSGVGRLAIGVAVAGFAAPAGAENWHLTLSGTAQLTYTNNLEYSAQGTEQSGFVGALTANVGINGGSPRAKANGAVSLSVQTDSSGKTTSSIVPTGALSSTLELIDKFAFVDASATFSQSYATVFGPQPANLANQTANRYTSQAYNISPYVKGALPGGATYLVRDDNTLTVSSSAGRSGPSPPKTYNNVVTARADSAPATIGWGIEYDRNYFATDIDPQVVGGGTSVIEQFRGFLPIRVTPELQVTPRAGYERDRFLRQDREDAIYGIGATWHPTERTNVDGYWEHRFFGDAYDLEISHRRPRSTFNASFRRDLSNYSALALTIPAGANVAQLLNAAFTTRIPDAAARADAVQQFMATNGLPPTLFAPIDLYAPTFTIQTSAQATLVLLGVRNSVSLTAFSSKTESLLSELAPGFGTARNSTEVGAGATFSHPISSLTVFTAFGTLSQARSDASSDSERLRSVNENLGAGLTTTLGARTTGTLTATYSRFLPHGGGVANVTDTSAVSVTAAVTHTFR